jgi:S1-C subfamily serine protease
MAPAALALLGAVSAPTAFAQQDADAQRRQTERQAEAQRRQADRQETQRDQAELQRELQKAREQLQEAAREVARLSAQIVNPVVKDVTQQLRFVQHRGVLGLAIEDTDLGVRVTGVTPNGAGAEAGIAVGDTIVAMDGADLAAPAVAGARRQSPSQLLMSQLANLNPGDDVELRILRNGDYRNVHAKAREPNWQIFGGPGFQMPSVPSVPNMWPEGFWRRNVWADLQLATLSPALGEYFGTKEGLLVVRAPKDSTLGLKDGDVILEIGGRKPTSPEHAMRILASFEPGETLRVMVMRHQKRETIDGKVPTASVH